MPVLTSPELGVMALKDVVERLDADNLAAVSANGAKVGR
jgi:hypothetical protein